MPGLWRITPQRVSQQYFLLLARCHSVKHTSETCQKSAGSRERLRKSAGKKPLWLNASSSVSFAADTSCKVPLFSFSFHQHVFSVLMLTKKLLSFFLSFFNRPGLQFPTFSSVT